MNPNYKKIAAKAVETVILNEMNSSNADPLLVLNRMKNVLVLTANVCSTLVDCLCELIPLEESQNAITLTKEVNGVQKYIVIYNKKATPVDLAIQLGHVILNHSANTKKESDEANYFANSFLCPISVLDIKNTVRYRPLRNTISSEAKDAREFESIESMKMFVAYERNKYNRFIGKITHYEADDVELQKPNKYDNIMGWKNCYDIVLDGCTVGYCGE